MYQASRHILTILALLVSMLTFSQKKPVAPYHLTVDSQYRYANYITKGWKFSDGDDVTKASALYDDSHWEEADPYLEISEEEDLAFNGIAWFRLHFIADSAITGKPLAICITHMGASQVYIDGKLIKSFGRINGADSSLYYDPREVPFIYTIADTGEHVLAVRYANYEAEKNYKTFGQSRAGFKLMIGHADSYIHKKNYRSTMIAFLLTMLAGIFIALGLIHLLLYFYRRSDRSNIYFSAFMFCLGYLFLSGLIGYSGTSPQFVLKCLFMVNPVVILACISISGFNRELFFKKNWLFVLIILIGVISFSMQILGISGYANLTISLIVTVSVEAVITIIIAMIRRIRGARIIGFGILFFTLFILTLFTLAMASGGNFDIDDSTTTGKIWEATLALSIISIPICMSAYQAWRFAGVNKDLALQLEQVQVLSQKTLEQELEKKKILESQKEKLEEEVMLRTAELRSEKKKSDDLLLNILPTEVANELKEKGSADAKQFDDVTVMFTDFKGFTQISEKLSASELVEEIHSCFKAFDNIIDKHNIEKIKTIGDSYMCAGGLPVANTTNAIDVVNAALEIQQFMQQHLEQRKIDGKEGFDMRIGIHTGPVVAGIVGVKKFAYDIWGDTVNTASRMESSGEAGKVNISHSTYELVKDKFICTHRGKIEAKNKGEVDMYFVEGVR